MKKFNILTIALMGVAAFSSCSTDRDHNPTLTVPQSFELLAPEIGSNVINLENSESIQFVAKAAPNYGFPTETSYWIEVTEAADFSDPTKVVATDTKGNSTIYEAPANEIDFAIMKLRGYEEESQVDKNEVINLNVRMVATLSHDTDGSTTVYSNTQSIKVTPYYLKEALPQLWYMVGDFIGDGSWGNAKYSNIGTGLIPMYVKAGEEYNRFTGKGKIEYVGYFHSDGSNGMKILAPRGVEGHPGVKDINPWMYGMGGGNFSDGSGYKSRCGGEETGNITIDAAGWYRLTLDNTGKEGDEELKIEAYEEEVEEPFTSMKIGDTEMQPMSTKAEVPNHDWYGVITLDADTEILFTANDGSTWGTDAFPMV